MSTSDNVVQAIMGHFDKAVRELGQEEYRDVLECVISDLQSRLDYAIEEMQAKGID